MGAKVQNNRVLRALSQARRWLLSVSALLGLVAFLQSYYKLSNLEILVLFSVLGIGVMAYLLVVAGGHLTAIENKIATGFSELSKKLEETTSRGQENTTPCKNRGKNPSNNLGNPHPSSQAIPKMPSEREPEQKPSGGGAFAGMVIGGALGTAGGPVGVIIGGIIGALIGNQIEYENIRKRKGGR